jgi:hypothetical protein
MRQLFFLLYPETDLQISAAAPSFAVTNTLMTECIVEDSVHLFTWHENLHVM